MSEGLPKHASILAVIEQLRVLLGQDAFVVADHWEADLYAVGLAAPGEAGRLVHISTFGQPPGRYNVSLELPPAPGSTSPYTPAGDQADVELAGLAALVRKYLRPPAPRAAG